MTILAVFGLGEAGALIAADLAAAGAEVRAYDPAPVATPRGVARVTRPREAVINAALVMGITAQQDAAEALSQALDAIPAAALYADLSTSAPTLKRQLAQTAGARGLAFADVALMATVPGKGIRTPALASGSGAELFVSLMTPFNMPVTAIGRESGDAAARKLLRSVMMKGLAALMIEALRAGHRAGCADWLWDNLAAEIEAADAELLARLVRGSGTHAVRRLHEMEASMALLEELGIDPVMTRSTIEALKRLPHEELPVIPTRK